MGRVGRGEDVRAAAAGREGPWAPNRDGFQRHMNKD